jgi:hypothetical protein
MIKLNILKLKGLKYPAFRTQGFKTQENHREVKPYFIILFLIGLVMSFFYYFYLKYYEGLYFVHYYEYYTRAVVITDCLTKLDFLSAFGYYFNSYVDKILIFRSVPFFLLFGPSQFLFFYSNVFFNFFLFLILFHSLLKIMQPEKAFYLTLFILSQYFFIELLASFYVDLSFFLICSIFFIYLSAFDKDPEKYNIRLAFIIFFIFLIKNVSYLLLAILGVLFIIYFFIAKRKKVSHVLRFSIILVTGFLIYYAIALKCSNERLITDLHASLPTIGLAESPTLISAISKIFKSFATMMIKNHYFLNKFPFLRLNFIIYPVVIFVTYKKREAFWIFLFFVSEIFLIFFYNSADVHHHDYRYFLPVYFIYIYFAYEFILIVSNKFFSKSFVNVFLLLSFSLLFLTSFIRLMDSSKRMIYTGKHFCADFFSEHLPVGSRIYLFTNDNLDYFHFYGSFIDRDKKDYSHLIKIDPRFKYKLLSSFENADYVIGNKFLKLDHKEYELIAAMGEYCLFKVK